MKEIMFSTCKPSTKRKKKMLKTMFSIRKKHEGAHVDWKPCANHMGICIPRSDLTDQQYDRLDTEKENREKNEKHRKITESLSLTNCLKCKSTYSSSLGGCECGKQEKEN
jgi:hypothetical protein